MGNLPTVCPMKIENEGFESLSMHKVLGPILKREGGAKGKRQGGHSDDSGSQDDRNLQSLVLHVHSPEAENKAVLTSSSPFLFHKSESCLESHLAYILSPR